MKRSKRILTAVLALGIVLGLSIPALAAAITKTITVETDVKVYVNDVGIDVGDTHGNPEAFIYNGTTYIAAKAVSNSLRQEVQWDGKNRSVYIGKHGDEGSNLFTVCPPYEEDSVWHDEIVTMAGEKYKNATIFDSYSLFYGSYDGWALFNLNGRYETLTFTAGHIDGEGMEDGTIRIYLDGEVAEEIHLTSGMLPREYTIPLDYALQMKVRGLDNCKAYALADMRVS